MVRDFQNQAMRMKPRGENQEEGELEAGRKNQNSPGLMNMLQG